MNSRNGYLKTNIKKISPDHIRYPSSLRRRADLNFPRRIRSKKTNLKIHSVEPSTKNTKKTNLKIHSVEPTRKKTKKTKLKIHTVEPTTKKTKKTKKTKLKIHKVEPSTISHVADPVITDELSDVKLIQGKKRNWLIK